MKFRAWIMEAGGTASLAKKLGKSQKAVQHWMTGYSRPKAGDIDKILKLGAGKLTLTDILSARK
jgi:hypothetical protein